MASHTIFSLEGKVLKLDSAEDIEPHIQALKENDDVEEVRFQGNTLGVDASKALAKVLETKKKLQIANFADVFTGRLLSEIPAALSALLTSLLTLPCLHTVDLSDNAFGLNTQEPLVAFLSEHVPLRHLVLNNNGLGPKAGVLIADALSTLAKRKAAAKAEGKEVSELETIVCGRNRLENGSMVAWSHAYAAHTGIREVKMVQNGIRQEGISHLLSNGLSHASKIRVLDLQDNTFTAMGAKALSNVVEGWTEIKELGVGDCLLSGRGAVALARALQQGKNGKLEVLRLQFNEINAKGVAALAEASSKLPALRRIELNGNKFEEEDPSITRLRELLEGRKEATDGADEDDEEYWGIDELDELESDDEDEGDEDEEAEAKAGSGSDDGDDGLGLRARAARELTDADEAEGANVAQDKDAKVDDLAEALAKTGIK